MVCGREVAFDPAQSADAVALKGNGRRVRLIAKNVEKKSLDMHSIRDWDWDWGWNQLRLARRG